MKQSEKLDLILKELYKHKYDGKYHSIADAFLLRKIPINIYVELRSLTQRLKDDGFIKVVFQRDDCFGELTTSGIEYCEKNSIPMKAFLYSLSMPIHIRILKLIITTPSK